MCSGFEERNGGESEPYDCSAPWPRLLETNPFLPLQRALELASRWHAEDH